jgi:SAM domain (Sterile alpha motif)
MSQMGQKCPKRLRLPAGKSTHEHMGRIVQTGSKDRHVESAERFAENDIDMAVLPDLTDQYLKDLGVSLGHRLKMLRAIRDLSGVPLAVPALRHPLLTGQLSDMRPSATSSRSCLATWSVRPRCRRG